LSLFNCPRRRAVHHFAADWTQWILFEQMEPDTPDHPAPSDVLHCNMPSATIVAATTCAGRQAQGKITLNHKHMRNAA
jgi:hypothetical protein